MQQRIVQIGFLFVFLLGVFLCFPPWHEWSPLPAMIRLDPLLWMGQWLSSQGVPAGLIQAGTVLLVTLVLGRFFCSHVCPLGTSLDAVSGLSKRARKGWQPPQSWRQGKYILLLAMLVAAVLGHNMTHWGSPLSLAGRLYALLIWPFIHFILQPAGLSPVLGVGSEPARIGQIGSLVLLLGLILGSAWVVPRFWCRYLCPTGAILAVFSRLAVFTRKVQTHCNACHLCSKRCPVGVAGPDEVPTGECLACRRCQVLCPEQAVSWLPTPLQGEKGGGEFWPERRQIAGAVALGAGVAWLSWGGLWAYRGEREKGQPKAENIIRPPGAIPERIFLNLCVRCGACMRVCPTNMLQPQGAEQGVQGLFAPVAVSRRGPCRPECTACGRVCPTGALRSLPVQEKMWAKMGTAVIYRDLCLAWEWDRACLVCDEACPYGAIDLRRVEGNQEAVPFVLEDRCSGCGACEHACPVQGRSAIAVSPTGSLRLGQGSYQQEGRRLGLKIDRGREDKGPVREPDSPDSDSGGLPPGFS
ncbi:MAG: 4Fe-4S binding protein [Desulfovermiculus sp.]|nr:4Fe-4S binding protein [Desulfovermiculus sp.]